MLKKIITLSLVFLSFGTLYAQQEAMYTHYMYNTLGVNPAYAGSRDALTITALHRSQWVGFDGAPTTQTLTLHSPFYNEKVNLGLSFLNDRIGPVNNTALFLDYAFRFNLTEKSKLALGLKVGFNTYHFSLSELQSTTPGDLANNISENSFSPNVGFGIYYSTDNFYAGISTPKLFQNNYHYEESSLSSGLTIEKRHFYTILGGVIPLTEDIKLKPTGFVKITQGAPIEGDITANVILYNQFHAGIMARTGDAIGLLVGYDITEQLFAGYSFDWSFVNKTGLYNGGSHEIVLRYDFIYSHLQRIRSPRYF